MTAAVHPKERTMQPSPAQSVEIAKYEDAYTHESYRMGAGRLAKAWTLLNVLPNPGSLLDVGTGRGELLQTARTLGFDPVLGTEVVKQLLRPGEVVFALATALPWTSGSWDTVVCCDVLEHLPPEDTIGAVTELGRVASSNLVLSVADYSHVFEGVELHVNRRQYDEWDAIFREHIPHRLVTRFRGLPEMWIVRK